jgi:hypothetical protein
MGNRANSPIGSKCRDGIESETTTSICKKWLDTKPINSILYVAFGSQTTPSKSQIKTLASALECSDKNLIWVFRPPSSFLREENDDEDVNEERMARSFKKGLVLENWAPQMKILSHKSVGAFLSHCGWNSVVEASSV